MLISNIKNLIKRISFIDRSSSARANATPNLGFKIDYGATNPVRAFFKIEFGLNERELNSGNNLYTVTVSINGAELLANSINDSSNHFIAINTHLLNNGFNTIELKLKHSSLATTRLIKINVMNTSPLAEKVRTHLLNHKAPIASLDIVDSTLFPKESYNILPWFDSNKTRSEIEALLSSWSPTPKELDKIEHFLEYGYMILEGAVDEKLADKCKSELEEAAKTGYQGYKDGSSQRLELLHEKYKGIRTLWQYPDVLRYLSLIFNSAPLPCQTLGYVYGSQQDLHQDAIHLTPYPRGYMCGVWVPLEDVQPQSGELIVVPKSHRLKRILRKDVDCSVVRNNEWNEFGEKVLPAWKGLPLV